MQKILNKTERQRLQSHFTGETTVDPLFEVCRNVFAERAASLEGAKADYEDVYLLVVYVLDSLFFNSNIEGQQDIDDIWNIILMQVREWPGATVNDRKIIADTVFRIVHKLLCHHWDTYYSDNLYELFSNTLDREKTNNNKEEQKRFRERLSDYSDKLDDWINNAYDGHLSEEIESAIAGKTAKVRVLKSRSGRKPKDVKSIVVTFDYLSYLSDRTARLQALFESLKGRFIAIDSELKDFINLFQNTTTKTKIVWIQEIVLLKYFILKIENYLTLPQGYTKWQIVCAHFQIRNKQIIINVENRDESYVIEDLSTKQFTKGRKIPKTHDELDRIIRILNPKIDYKESLQEYLDYQQEHDERMDENDALAHGLNTDIHI